MRRQTCGHARCWVLTVTTSTHSQQLPSPPYRSVQRSRYAPPRVFGPATRHPAHEAWSWSLPSPALAGPDTVRLSAPLLADAQVIALQKKGAILIDVREEPQYNNVRPPLPALLALLSRHPHPKPHRCQEVRRAIIIVFAAYSVDCKHV